MKFFFFSKTELDDYKKKSKTPFENSGLFGTILNFDCNSLEEALKRIYDATDIIADKRYDEEDQELNSFVKTNIDDFSNNTLLRGIKEKVDNIHRIQDTSRKEESELALVPEFRLRVLNGMFQYVESLIAKPSSKQIDKAVRILYFLTSANICLRISQVYYETSDFRSANEWGDRGGEIIWHGRGVQRQELERQRLELGLSDTLKDVPKLITNDQLVERARKYLELVLYGYALRLNHAIYYLDYARKNRRSNFSSAMAELDTLTDSLELIGYTQELSQILYNFGRGLGLIYVDANQMKIQVQRRKFATADARNRVINLIMAIYPDDLGDEIFDTKNSISDYRSEEIKNSINALLDCLDEYDKKRSRVLNLLFFARTQRDSHSAEAYQKAIEMACKANRLSQELDQDNKDSYGQIHNNMDAIIIISSSFRRLFQAEKLPEIESFCSEQKRNKGAEFLTLEDVFGYLYKMQKAKYFNAISERIKWYYFNLSLGNHSSRRDFIKLATEAAKEKDNTCRFLNEEEIDAYFGIESSQGINSTPAHLNLKFLEGIVHLKKGECGITKEYEKAEECFLDLLKNKEYRDLTNYIRPVTIGLKSRYLLARTYLSFGKYTEAIKYLEEVMETIQQLKNSKQIDLNYWDYRTVVELAYCYIRQGDYKKAYKLYRDIGVEKTSLYPRKKCEDAQTQDLDDKDRKEETRIFLSRLSDVRRISALNNLIRCCLFYNDETAYSEDTSEIMQLAANTLDYLREEYSENWESNLETNLLRGYYEIVRTDYVCRSDFSGTDYELQKYKRALERFEISCHYQEGFIMSLENKSADLSRHRHNVEYLSAYVITTVQLYKLTKQQGLADESKKYEERLKSFLYGIPKKIQLSMNATISLAEWLLELADRNRDSCQQYLRSFCYVTIYEERGAMVFNQLKDNRFFRLLGSQYRGEILALLLAMYKPIKALKEGCVFNLNDLEKLRSENTSKRLDRRMDLVHYTSLNTLKLLLETEKARFRINNCGYMNDVFEGDAFLNCLREMADSVGKESGGTLETEKEYDNDFNTMLYRYFPSLSKDEKDRKPMASNVYIGSLSVKADSFPIWDCYADKEKGCNICFGERFFDINGNACAPHQLRNYMFSYYTDESYPLYTVQYIEDNFEERIQEYIHKEGYYIKQESLEQLDILNHKKSPQHCGTWATESVELCRLLHHIYLRWKKLESRLNSIVITLGYNNQPEEGISLARQFAADRLNEVRFLFKNSDYEFEAEVRIVHTEKADGDNIHIEYRKEIPGPYTDIDRELKGLTIGLGSRITDSDIDKITTWLKQTGRVKTVMLSTRNRYIKRIGNKAE